MASCPPAEAVPVLVLSLSSCSFTSGTGEGGAGGPSSSTLIFVSCRHEANSASTAQQQPTRFDGDAENSSMLAYKQQRGPTTAGAVSGLHRIETVGRPIMHTLCHTTAAHSHCVTTIAAAVRHKTCKLAVLTTRTAIHTAAAVFVSREPSSVCCAVLKHVTVLTHPDTTWGLECVLSQLLHTSTAQHAHQHVSTAQLCKWHMPPGTELRNGS
jgi:hypothetical protein